MDDILYTYTVYITYYNNKKQQYWIIAKPYMLKCMFLEWVLLILLNNNN